MADETKNRRDDAALDANLSVLGDEGKEPHVGRVGSAPQPQAESSLEEELDKGRAGPGDGNLDPTSQRAARESAADNAASYGKTPTSR